MTNLTKSFTLLFTVSRYNVRLINEGDTYGLKDCVTHKEPEPMIEFYLSTPEKETFENRGWFISRYYLSTLAKHKYGLALCGHEPDLGVSVEELQIILTHFENALGHALYCDLIHTKK